MDIEGKAGRTLLVRGISIVGLFLVAPLLLVFRGGGRAMKAAPGVLPPGLLPLRGLLMLGCPPFQVALHIWVGHQVNVAVAVALEAHKHHAWRDGDRGQ